MNRRMPADWDELDLLARYKAARILIESNPDYCPHNMDFSEIDIVSFQETH